MSPESAALLKAVLNSHQRYELALSKFPNLEALQRIEPPSQYQGFDQYPAAVQALL
ncbi:hypothetical protein [Microbacterium suaedae]|uniref:hypothetical protein n=1 Tax=Microbacterium suaedae TaxID=2067813 RepID=UPI0013A607E4|nr:hypothetical protein [Microbacterium suaedae]